MLTYRDTDWANDLSEEEKQAIYQGIREADAGNLKPYNEVRGKAEPEVWVIKYPSLRQRKTI